jgi:transcriptional regulator with XRE-family HTH domain
MDDGDATFGSQLRAVRLERAMTQQELAERVGCGDKRHVSYFENGHRDPHLSTIRRFAAVLGCSTARLVEDGE